MIAPACTQGKALAPIRIGRRTFDYSTVHVMGIVNVTPDSFFDGGHHMDRHRAVDRAAEMLDEGADIIDIGGESTRPGSRAVDAEEEMDRVMPVIAGLRARFDVPISIDTTKVQVARAAADAGADLLNDVSGLRFEPDLADLAAERGLPMVLMHSRHTPEIMQREVHYDDLKAEILAELTLAVDLAVGRGVPRDRIIVDPGLGFAKTALHNLEILAMPGFLASMGLPVLVGPSNKSFISAVTDCPVERRTGGSAAAVTAAVMGGVHFIRVHDVATMRQAALVASAMRSIVTKGGGAWMR